MTNLIAVAAVLVAPFASAAACPTCTLVHYTVTVAPADSLGLAVEMRINNPPRPLRVTFAPDPAHPGSPAGTLAGNLRDLAAAAGTTPLRVTRESGGVWRVDGATGNVTLRYRVLVAPPSRGGPTSTVRPDGALIEPHATFLSMLGRAAAQYTVQVAAPGSWQASTALRRSADGPNLFIAPTFDALVAAPITVGREHGRLPDLRGIAPHTGVDSRQTATPRAPRRVANTVAAATDARGARVSSPACGIVASARSTRAGATTAPHVHGGAPAASSGTARRSA